MTINLNLIGRYASLNGAEIPAFDSISQRLFVVAGDVVEILNLSDATTITKIEDLPLNTQAVGEGFALIPNSVAVGKKGTVSEGIVAVGLAIVETATGNHARGEVQFFNASTGAFLGKQTVGFLPDMVTFTPDGTKLLTANEGEPNEDYTFDPEGSISIINLSNGIANATVQEATFTAFNSQIDQLRAEGVRIFGTDATVSEDVEPEYITFSGDGTKAWVTLQENNAIAVVDIATATVESIIPLGFKDHSLEGNGLDASDRDSMIDIKNHPVFGMYLPDTIASYTVNGETYYVTANEGDARVRPTDDDILPDVGEGDLYNEESGVDDLILDPVAFPNFKELQEDENLGRLTVTNTLGQSDRAVFVSELDGSQEVTPVDTEAQGEAFAWVDDNGFLQVELEVTGLDFGALNDNPLTETTADDVTMLHIHQALRGVNGGVVWNILTDADTVINIDEDGTTNITSTWQENTIEKTEQGEDTEFYFNLHTTGNPSGEIRGQIVGEIAYDELYAFGARSFTIWDSEGNLVFDSGDDFESITAQAFPDYFNASNSNNNFDNRSDNKGSEPEGVTVGTINGQTYAFVGLERIGGVMVYNVSNPETPEFVQYINTRNFEEDPETNLTDSGPEGLTFISAKDSPNGKPLLVVSNEVSNTTNIFEIDTGFTPPNQPSQMQGLETFEVQPVFTVGEIVPSGDGEYYVPPGILDGLGAFALDEDTIRVLANHELSSDVGYTYTLANGTQLTGGRVSFFDINKETRELEAAGLAYDRIFNRAGEEVDEATDLEFMGLDRLCSAQYIEAEQFGDNRGLVDGLFFTGEETDGGTEFVLDPVTNTLYAVPWMGRAAWESVTELDTGTTDKVALLIGDDRGGAPLLLYVGEKGQGEGADILVRNGLAQGKLYVWVADSGETTPEEFNGTFETRSGSFVEIDYYRPDLAGNGEYDELGFATQAKQDALRDEVGGFNFSRPEDLATSPDDGTVAVLASTGRDSLFPSDSWGTTYKIDADFSDLNNITTQLDVLYQGDDAGDGQFEGSDFGLRSPDNLEWADNGLIYIQEDRSFGGFGQTSGEEASIWELNPETGILTRIAQIDRTAVPEGQTDSSPNDIGNWESSGIIDVSTLFDETPGSLFLFDVQAHSLRDGIIATEGLVQGGQLAFLENTNPNPNETIDLGDDDGEFDFNDRTNNLNIIGGEGDQTIISGSGNDTIDPGNGNNIVNAGAGDDIIIGKASPDFDNQIDGGDGNDKVIYDGAFADFPISVENGVVTVGNNTDTLTNVEQLQFTDRTVLVEDLVTEPPVEPPVETLLNDPFFRFQNSDRPGTYIYAGDVESQNIRQNFPQFEEEGFAFNVSEEADDQLMRFNRFQNMAIPGSYLYAGEAESQSIRQNFPNFKDEGIAFYALEGNANLGVDIYRLQNTLQPGTYIFVGEEEKNSILANFRQFTLEGVAFEVVA